MNANHRLVLPRGGLNHACQQLRVCFGVPVAKQLINRPDSASKVAMNGITCMALKKIWNQHLAAPIKKGKQKGFDFTRGFALLMLSIALAQPGTALAADWLTLSGASHHSTRQQANGQRWHEINPGAGFERDLGDSLVFATGAYRNSYGKPTAYAALRWEPLQLGRLKLGLMAGPATGYQYHALAVATATLRITDDFGLLIVGAPKVEKGGAAFVGLNLRIRF